MALQDVIADFVKTIEEIAEKFKKNPLDPENLTKADALLEAMARTDEIKLPMGNTLAKQLAKALDTAVNEYSSAYKKLRKQYELEQSAAMPDVQHEIPFNYESKCEASGSQIVNFILAKYGEEIKYNPHTKQVMMYNHTSGIWEAVGEANSIEFRNLIIQYIKGYIGTYEGIGTSYDSSLISSVANILLPQIVQYEWNHDTATIALIGGYLSIESTGEFEVIEPHPSYYITHQIKAEYDEKAQCPTIDKFIEQLTSYEGKPSPAKIERFLAFMRIILTVKIRRYQKFLHLYGPSGAGKSTALKLISKLITNYQETTLSALESGSFELARLTDADLIIISEADDYKRFLGDKGVFKQLTSGDYAPRDEKHKNLNGDEATFEAHAAVILATEHPLTGGMAIERRSCGIGCKNIPEKIGTNDVIENFEAELSGFLNRVLAFTERQALEIINRAPKDSALEIKQEAKETLLAGNYLFQWLDECVVYVPPPAGYPDIGWNTSNHTGVTIGKLTENRDEGRGYQHGNHELLPSLYNWGIESGEQAFHAVRRYSKQNLRRTLINTLKHQWKLFGIEDGKTGTRRPIYGIAVRTSDNPNDPKAEWPSVVDIYLGIQEPLNPESQLSQPHWEPEDDAL